jgi:GNAT superfamily N-acetyltransferase
LRHFVEAAEAEKRTLVVGQTAERVPAGEAFVTRMEAEKGIANHINRLVLDEVDCDLVRSWVEAGPGRAPDYSLIALDGPYPDELFEDIVDLRQVMNTAPRDDLDMEDMKFTSEHARQWEKSMIASGTERWGLFARHDPTGTLAGYTEVFYNSKLPQTVGQGDTAVRPEHRGHALGKWLKAAMIRRVLEERPEAKDIRTGNADSNDAMLGINHQLGFRPFEASMVWQVPVEKVRAYLDG